MPGTQEALNKCLLEEFCSEDKGKPHDTLVGTHLDIFLLLLHIFFILKIYLFS